MTKRNERKKSEKTQLASIQDWLHTLPDLYLQICSQRELQKLYDFHMTFKRLKYYERPRKSRAEMKYEKRWHHFKKYDLIGKNYPTGPCPYCDTMTHCSSWVWRVNNQTELVKPRCRRCHKWIRTHG